MGTTTFVVCVAGLLAGVWLLWRIPAPGRVTHDLSRVSVVVPARDEEHTLPDLLASLQHQLPGEVVVVDDHSSDATAAVARQAGARVVAAPELPPGWTGKAWACWSGAAATSGPVLVFLDADTRLHRGGLQKVVGELEDGGGMLGVQPFHTTVRQYERLAAFFNLVGMMGVDAFTPLRRRFPPTATFGPCLVTSRSDYDAVGGHEAVRAAVVEDVALARLYRASGKPVRCFGGRGVVDFRMYPEGVRQLVEGFSKNFGKGAAGTRPATLLLVFSWITGAILAVAGVRRLSPWAALPYAGYVVQLTWMLRRIGRFGWWPVAVYPLPLAFFVAVFARSLVLTYVRKEVTWRGRRIPT